VVSTIFSLLLGACDELFFLSCFLFLSFFLSLSLFLTALFSPSFLRISSHGCPPHGGVALGLDRMIALLCDAPSIRDVIAFPKSATGNDLLTGSPSNVTAAQLAEYHIALAK
jgi:hypothetical protein